MEEQVEIRIKRMEISVQKNEVTNVERCLKEQIRLRALLNVLLEKGVFTAEEYGKHYDIEGHKIGNLVKESLRQGGF